VYVRQRAVYQVRVGTMLIPDYNNYLPDSKSVKSIVMGIMQSWPFEEMSTAHSEYEMRLARKQEAPFALPTICLASK
jgi:hypothetical protein